MTNRRNFLKVAGIGVAATTIPGFTSASATPARGKKSNPDIKLGVASYTLRKFSREEALEMTLRCGVNRITFKSALYEL